MGSDLDPDGARLGASRRRALARRDRPGARGQVRHPRPRRADGGAARGRRRAPARDAAAPAARAASASSMSPTGSTRCSASPTASPCCATAGGSTTVDGRRDHRRPISSRMIVGRSMTDAFVKPAPAVGPRRARRSSERGRRARRPGLLHGRAPAKRSAWSACAAPAITPSGARSSARSRSRPAMSRSTASRVDPADPADAMRQRHRLRLEPARRGEHRRQPGGAREHLHESGRHGQGRARADRPRRRGCADSRGGAPALLDQGRRTRSSRSPRSPAATSRRSSSPAGWRPKVTPARPRGADHRRRRRLEGGDLPSAAAVAAGRAWPCC